MFVLELFTKSLEQYNSLFFDMVFIRTSWCWMRFSVQPNSLLFPATS